MSENTDIYDQLDQIDWQEWEDETRALLKEAEVIASRFQNVDAVMQKYQDLRQTTIDALADLRIDTANELANMRKEFQDMKNVAGVWVNEDGNSIPDMPSYFQENTRNWNLLQNTPFIEFSDEEKEFALSWITENYSDFRGSGSWWQNDRLSRVHNKEEARISQENLINLLYNSSAISHWFYNTWSEVLFFTLTDNHWWVQENIHSIENEIENGSISSEKLQKYIHYLELSKISTDFEIAEILIEKNIHLADTLSTWKVRWVYRALLTIKDPEIRSLATTSVEKLSPESAKKVLHFLQNDSRTWDYSEDIWLSWIGAMIEVHNDNQRDTFQKELIKRAFWEALIDNWYDAGKLLAYSREKGYSVLTEAQFNNSLRKRDSYALVNYVASLSQRYNGDLSQVRQILRTDSLWFMSPNEIEELLKESTRKNSMHADTMNSLIGLFESPEGLEDIFWKPIDDLSSEQARKALEYTNEFFWEKNTPANWFWLADWDAWSISEIYTLDDRNESQKKLIDKIYGDGTFETWYTQDGSIIWYSDEEWGNHLSTTEEFEAKLQGGKEFNALIAANYIRYLSSQYEWDTLSYKILETFVPRAKSQEKKFEEYINDDLLTFLKASKNEDVKSALEILRKERILIHEWWVEVWLKDNQWETLKDEYYQAKEDLESLCNSDIGGNNKLVDLNDAVVRTHESQCSIQKERPAFWNEIDTELIDNCLQSCDFSKWVDSRADVDISDFDTQVLSLETQARIQSFWWKISEKTNAFTTQILAWPYGQVPWIQTLLREYNINGSEDLSHPSANGIQWAYNSDEFQNAFNTLIQSYNQDTSNKPLPELSGATLDIIMAQIDEVGDEDFTTEFASKLTWVESLWGLLDGAATEIQNWWREIDAEYKKLNTDWHTTSSIMEILWALSTLAPNSNGFHAAREVILSLPENQGTSTNFANNSFYTWIPASNSLGGHIDNITVAAKYQEFGEELEININEQACKENITKIFTGIPEWIIDVDEVFTGLLTKISEWSNPLLVENLDQLKTFLETWDIDSLDDSALAELIREVYAEALSLTESIIVSKMKRQEELLAEWWDPDEFSQITSELASLFVIRKELQLSSFVVSGNFTLEGNNTWVTAQDILRSFLDWEISEEAYKQTLIELYSNNEAIREENERLEWELDEKLDYIAKLSRDFISQISEWLTLDEIQQKKELFRFSNYYVLRAEQNLEDNNEIGNKIVGINEALHKELTEKWNNIIESIRTDIKTSANSTTSMNLANEDFWNESIQNDNEIQSMLDLAKETEWRNKLEHNIGNIEVLDDSRVAIFEALQGFGLTEEETHEIFWQVLSKIKKDPNLVNNTQHLAQLLEWKEFAWDELSATIHAIYTHTAQQNAEKLKIATKEFSHLQDKIDRWEYLTPDELADIRALAHLIWEYIDFNNKLEIENHIFTTGGETLIEKFLNGEITLEEMHDQVRKKRQESIAVLRWGQVARTWHIIAIVDQTVLDASWDTSMIPDMEFPYPLTSEEEYLLESWAYHARYENASLVEEIATDISHSSSTQWAVATVTLVETTGEENFSSETLEFIEEQKEVIIAYSQSDKWQKDIMFQASLKHMKESLWEENSFVQSLEKIESWEVRVIPPLTAQNISSPNMKTTYREISQELTLSPEEQETLTEQELTLIASNENAKERFVEFRTTLKELWLTELWRYRNEIFRSIAGMSFSITDGDYISENELNIFLSKSVYATTQDSRLKTTPGNITSTKQIIREVNRQTGGFGDINAVNVIGEPLTLVEYHFREKFAPRNAWMISYYTQAFRDALKS